MPPTLREVYAVIYDEIPTADFAHLKAPTLLMYDPQTPKPAQHVIKHYKRLFPHCTWHTFDGLGHLAPIHSPEQVNPIIMKHLLTHR